MSRFGKLPVELPSGVSVKTEDSSMVVTGPKGTLKRDLPRGISIVQAENVLNVERKADTKEALAMQGTIRAHLINMIKGVNTGWEKNLELVGSGYRAEVRGKELVLNIGYSHPISFMAPENITFSVEKTKIKVAGIDRDVVGQLAALIRETRKPDPYKAKGVKYENEVIRRKAGKQAAKAGAA